jgi:hypothetical protein
MKVQVWTKFRKKNLWKKVKSPLSMNFGRISTSKCRGDRWSPAAGRHLRLWDSSNFLEIFLFKKKEFLEVWVMGQGF